MLADVGFVGFLAWIGAGVGDRLLGLFKQQPVRPDHALALAVPLGLGILSLATLGLGLIARLDRASLLGLLGTAALLAAGPGTRLILKSACLMKARTVRVLTRGSIFDRALLGFVMLALGGSALAATLPVTDGDALCYHLQVPKVFLARKAVGFEPDLHETVYPLMTELLDAIALEFRGPVACRWVQFLLGLVLASNVSLLAWPILRARSWWAGSIALLVPAISNGMVAPLNDLALAAFGTAAIAATMRTIDRPTIRSAALAGCFVGLALGVKYPALVLLGLLTIVVAAGSIVVKGSRGNRLSELWCGRPACIQSEQARRLHHKNSMRIRGLDPPSPLVSTFVFVTSALIVGGCWYLRAYLNTGNPVFPYFRQVFGGSGLDEVMDPTRRSMSVTPWNILTAIVPMTLSPDRFESFAHQFGPVFLLFLPAIAFERPPRRVMLLVAIGYSFLMICVTQRQSMRFVLTALGPLSVGVAYLVRVWSLRRSIPARVILGILLVALGMESVQALSRCRNGLKVILGRESAEQYLSEREPTYRVGNWIDRNLPATARLIGQDHRGYYFPRDYTMELAHRRRTGLGRRGESASEVLDHLKRSGFTHLLLCPPIPEDALEFDPTLGRILEPWVRGREPLFREDLADADGIIRRYTVYRLDDTGAIASSAPSDPEGVTR